LGFAAVAHSFNENDLNSKGKRGPRIAYKLTDCAIKC